MAKTKTEKQVRYLLSSGSPLKHESKIKLQDELRTGAVKVRKKK